MNEIYDVVIIGGATAGMTAGIYCGRKKLKTIILTKKIGGQSLLTNEIENYPGFEIITGPDLSEKVVKQVEKIGVPIKEDAVVTTILKKREDMFSIKLESGEEIGAKAIIIATGKNPRHLNIPGEKEFLGKGLSFCSICDAPLFSGKDVAVVGGGNSGLESALDLTKYANKIYILTRGDKLRGDEILQSKLKESGKVEFIMNAQPVEVKGENFVNSIIYKNTLTNDTKELSVGGIFVHVGWDPATTFTKGLVNLNEYNEIVIDKNNGTSAPGIFAAGDVTDTKYKQYAIAVGEGAKAALSVYDYLMKK
jgi:thioredoxin-disulfide reductase